MAEKKMTKTQETIKTLIYQLGFRNASMMSKAIGIDYMRLYNLESGRSKKFSVEIADAICKKYPQVNRAYLLADNGTLFNEEEDKSAKQTISLDQIKYAQELVEREKRLNEREMKLNERELKIAQRELELNIGK